ncbi:hypothetical protein FQN49_005740 [Arthroderma sp. PD_2]|nr:hypothetical protein FQN49_005740 [Arthroderma sp. PD_2]
MTQAPPVSQPAAQPSAPRQESRPPTVQQTTHISVARSVEPRAQQIPFQRRTNLQPQTSTASPETAPLSATYIPLPPHPPVTVSTATFNNNPSLVAPRRAYANPPIPQQVQLVAQPPQTRLLPPPNSRALVPANPSPVTSFHQAHLDVVNISLAKRGSNEPGENLFQHVESFAVAPTLLNWHQQLYKLSMSLSPEEHARLPKQFKTRNTPQTVQGVIDGSKIYQMRCVRLTNAVPLTEERWVMAECSWPKAIYIRVNGQEHHLRRKFHFGKDLPVNIATSLLKGANDITVTILGDTEERNKSIFAIAVEIVDVASYGRVRQAVQTLSQPQSLDRIVKRLTNNTMDSDELCIIDDFVTVPLIDPFMARIFDVPIRTISCKHSECFDLDTFLTTRRSRSMKGPHGMAEDWKCPICNEDARPKCLVIDEFLVHVREELIRRKLLDEASAIKVRADRSWDVSTRQSSCMKNTGDLSVKAGGSETTTTNATSSSPTPAQAPPEIIELD